MKSLVAQVTTLLRAATTDRVEQYWRLEPPEVLTYYVTDRSESSQRGHGIGNSWQETLSIDVVVEVPWDDTVATAEALNDAVEVVKAAVHANRDLSTTGITGRVEGTQYQFVIRAGVAQPCKAARIGVSYETNV